VGSAPDDYWNLEPAALASRKIVWHQNALIPTPRNIETKTKLMVFLNRYKEQQRKCHSDPMGYSYSVPPLM
jgi:hypothetical protein